MRLGARILLANRVKRVDVLSSIILTNRRFHFHPCEIKIGRDYYTNIWRIQSYLYQIKICDDPDYDSEEGWQEILFMTESRNIDIRMVKSYNIKLEINIHLPAAPVCRIFIDIDKNRITTSPRRLSETLSWIPALINSDIFINLPDIRRIYDFLTTQDFTNKLRRLLYKRDSELILGRDSDGQTVSEIIRDYNRNATARKLPWFDESDPGVGDDFTTEIDVNDEDINCPHCGKLIHT